MSKKVIIPLVLMILTVIAIMAGGFASFAQFNIGKVGEQGVVEPIQEAQEKKMEQLSEGMSTPPPPSTPATGEPAPINVEEIPEDVLRDAIQNAAGSEIFAKEASRTVRAYIKKIKVGPRAYEQEFEEGKAPWAPRKPDVRYSPFDPVMTSQKQPSIGLKPVPPFIPPQGRSSVGPAPLDLMKALVNLRMTTKAGDQYIALVEIAGIPIDLKVGDVLQVPPGVFPDQEFPEIVVDGISMDGVEFRSGTQFVHVGFTEVGGTSEKPFTIEVTP
jgi:hypothetical protein